MRYLLDTNAVIALLSGHAAVHSRMRAGDANDFGISAIVAHELFFGACESRRRAENLKTIEALKFEVLEFDREDARCAGEIRAALSAAGMQIGPYDVLIAGQAVARSLTVITHNVKEFQRIPQLHVEDWEV